MSWAAYKGHLNIVQYLLTSTELKKHADIHKNHDESFIWACNHNQLEIIKYFIFDRNIEKTKNIKNYLYSNSSHPANHMFKARELSDELENELFSDSINNKTKLKL